MDFSAALFVWWVCVEGVWRQQLDQGRPDPDLLSSSKQVCLTCGDICSIVVLAPLRAGEIPAAAFEAGCKYLLPHAEPELNPRWSILCSVLEASLSPIPLPLRMLLKSILSDVFASEQTCIPQYTRVLARLARAALLSPSCFLLSLSRPASVRAPLSTLSYWVFVGGLFGQWKQFPYKMSLDSCTDFLACCLGMLKFIYDLL